MPDMNKISLSDAHAALDKVAMSSVILPPAGSLLDQATISARAQTAAAQPIPPPFVPGLATLQQAVSAGQTAQQETTDLLTLVRAKLNRVASEFGIDYALVRDFFTSHL